MEDDPDIVVRLRSYTDGCIYYDLDRYLIEAADEIELLRKRLREIKDGFEGCCPACEPVGEMNKRLREERDEARRRVCEMSLELGQVYRRVGGKTVQVTTAEGVADMMQWDCYPHEYMRRQKALDEIARISEQLGLDLPPKQKDFLQDLG